MTSTLETTVRLTALEEEKEKLTAAIEETREVLAAQMAVDAGVALGDIIETHYNWGFGTNRQVRTRQYKVTGFRVVGSGVGKKTGCAGNNPQQSGGGL